MVTLKKGVIIPALQRGHMTFRDDLTPCHPGNRWWNQYRVFFVGLNLYSQYQDTLAGKVSMELVIVSKNDIRSISLTLHKSIQNRSSLELQTYTNGWRETSGKPFKMGLYVKSVLTGLQQQRKYPIPKSTNIIIKLHSKKKRSSEWADSLQSGRKIFGSYFSPGLNL